MAPLAVELDRSLRCLDPDTAALLERTVWDALALAARRSENGPTVAKDAMGYPLGHFEATVGSFANEPLEVAPDLPLPVREDW